MDAILIVDDEKPMRDLLRLYITHAGFAVTEAADASAALAAVRREPLSLAIVDWMMPGMSGIELCRAIRLKTDVPILMLTARGLVEDRVAGLHAGADDYLTKPFDPRELVARVEALLRRSGSVREGVVHCGPSAIDPAGRVFTVFGQAVPLTRREFDLIEFLSRHPKRAFRRDELLDAVWGADFFGDARTVDTHVRSLREKLREARADSIRIETLRGVGYLFHCDSGASDA